MLELGNRHSRDPHSGNKNQTPYSRSIVKPIAGCIASYFHQPCTFVIAQRMCADSQILGSGSNIPLSVLVISDQVAQRRSI